MLTALDGYDLMGCAVRSRAILGVWGQRPEEDDPLEPQPTTLFFFYPDEVPEERWAHRGPVPAQAVYLCPAFTPKEQWIAVFSDGDVWAIGGGDDGPESSIDGNRSVYVRALRSIRGVPHAVGPKAVWRRDAADQWSRLGDGLDGNVDLRDVAGFDTDGSVYACGEDKLWCHDGHRWSPVEIAGAAKIERVHCGADGRIYLVDRAAELLAGTPETGWIRASMPNEERVVAVVGYGDRLLVTSQRGLYEMQGARIVSSSLPPPPLDSFTSLDARDGVLFAVGRRQAAFYDGARWNRIV